MKLFLLILCFVFISPESDAQTSPAPFAQIRITDSVACTPVKDQSSSPTCWVFGTNSLFESDLLKKNLSAVRQDKPELNLSEMFIARYAYIDKVRAYLASGGKTYCEGGGQFHDVIRVINKYGMAPEDAYPGLPKGQYSHNHAGLDSGMKVFIKKLVKDGIKELNNENLRKVNDTLDKYLGKVPASFWYNLKQYTPKSFADEMMPSSDEYVEVMSFADLPYYQKCLLNDKFNWAGDSLYNLPLADFQEIVDTALAGGWSVGWEGDVTEPGFEFLTGYASIKDSSAHQFDKERLTDFKNEKTERDHMLHLVGSGKDADGNKWYYLKNSWGTWFSHFKGFLYMQENYFKLKTVVLMVNKAALPENLKIKLGF
jgi:bleomycin hydrolase